jgi:hypothetical protein
VKRIAPSVLFEFYCYKKEVKMNTKKYESLLEKYFNKLRPIIPKQVAIIERKFIAREIDHVEAMSKLLESI